MKAEVSLMISLNRSSLHYLEKVGYRNQIKDDRERQYLGRIHLVDSDDELAHTEGKGKESVLSSLAILGDTSFEFTSATSNDENGTVSLRRSCDHVFDEIAVTRGINDLKWQINV